MISAAERFIIPGCYLVYHRGSGLCAAGFQYLAPAVGRHNTLQQAQVTYHQHLRRQARLKDILQLRVQPALVRPHRQEHRPAQQRLQPGDQRAEQLRDGSQLGVNERGKKDALRPEFCAGKGFHVAILAVHQAVTAAYRQGLNRLHQL